MHQSYIFMKKRLLQFVTLAFASVIIVIGTTSCGTIRGIGEDVGRAGNVIERAASR